MKKVFHGTYAYKTDTGLLRSNNEDQALVTMNASGEVFLIVCDGMGGAKKGDLASKIAIDTLAKAFKNKKRHHFPYFDRLWLTRVCREANSLIYKSAEKNEKYRGMGTTLVAALLSGDRLLIANIGDSRAYMIKERALHQLTEDQTYVRYLVNTGSLSEKEASYHPDRHVLMNALGVYPSLSVTFSQFKYDGEPLLLCSDGLYNQVPPKEIVAVLSTDERVDQKVLGLILEANEAGGNDNAAVAYWEVIDHD